MLRRLRDTNEWAVTHVAALLATIWAVDFFLLLSVLPVLAQPSILTVFYLSSGILQLVALPVLAFMSARIQQQGDAAQALAMRLQQETHEMVKNELADLSLDLKEESEIKQLLTKLEVMESSDAATEGRILTAIETLAGRKR
jgi:competence protein ComGC